MKKKDKEEETKTKQKRRSRGKQGDDEGGTFCYAKEGSNN
jgi:hypothetical protein